MMLKKGSVLDIIPIIVIVTGVSIAVLFSGLMINKYEENLPTERRTEEVNETLSDADTAVHMFDTGILFFLGGAFVVVLMLGYLIPSHPVFYAFTWIIVAIVLMISAVYSNMFIEVAESSVLMPITNSYPSLYLVMKNLPMITLGYATLLSIVMYATGSPVKQNV